MRATCLMFIVMLFIAGCGTAILGDQLRYRVADGPVRISVTTPWGGSGTIDIEQGGRVWFGPDVPDFYTATMVPAVGDD